MVGAMVAVLRGAVPLSYLDVALNPDAFLPVPAPPAAAFLLAQCSFQVGCGVSVVGGRV